MATSLGSRESKQASRLLVVILAALEDLLADEAQPVFYRRMAWCLMLQSWGTLRFADHRGLELRNVRFEAGALIAKLTARKLWELINLSVHGSSLSIRKRIFETEAGSLTDGFYSRQKRPAKGTTFSQHPVEITKEFNAKNYDTSQHLQSKQDSWDHYSIVGPGSSTCLSRISGALTADAIFYRQRSQSSEHRLRTRTFLGDGQLKAASGTTE